MSEKLERLSERFPVEDVKQRRQGGAMLDYISIDATIRRLNDVLDLGWSFEIDTTQLLPMEGGKYLALVQGNRFTPEELARFQALIDAARAESEGRKTRGRRKGGD